MLKANAYVWWRSHTHTHSHMVKLKKKKKWSNPFHLNIIYRLGSELLLPYILFLLCQFFSPFISTMFFFCTTFTMHISVLFRFADDVCMLCCVCVAFFSLCFTFFLIIFIITLHADQANQLYKLKSLYKLWIFDGHQRIQNPSECNVQKYSIVCTTYQMIWIHHEKKERKSEWMSGFDAWKIIGKNRSTVLAMTATTPSTPTQ